LKPSRAYALLSLLYLALAAVLVISNTTYRKRMQDRAILADREDQYAAAHADDRYVDIGITLRIVVADEEGEELLPGKPKLRILREHHFGGRLDKRMTPPAIVAPSKDPVVWYASEDQETILLNIDGPPAQLVEGAEGSGKTTTLVMWHALQWLSHLGEGREGLQTAPTNIRLGLVRREIRKLWRSEWYRYVTRKDFVGYELCDGSAIRFVSTHRTSEAAGSPVQGFNSSWAGRDETQDQTEVHEDIESRGRAARDGIYPQLGTATVKDTSAYREFRETLPPTDWKIRPLVVAEAINNDLNNLRIRTPFLKRSFVESKKRTMSAREFRRRYLAELLPPELAVYYGWSRQRNLITVPRLGAVDVTPHILSSYQSYCSPKSRFVLVGCHDPGNIINVTEVLRLLVIGGVPTWVAVGEFKTEQTTAEQHAEQFLDYVQKTFGIERRLRDRLGRAYPDPDSSKVAVFVDPHGKGESQTDYQTVYGAFQKFGIDVFSPAPLTGKIKRSARVEMMNRLLAGTAADPAPRFAIARDEQGHPLAPVLVDAFESMVKRPGDDDPEGVRKKDASDKTHAPAATSYGLWPFEQQAITVRTIEAALLAAKALRV
jgi:hypothetical protein